MSEVFKNVVYRVSRASAHLTFPRVAQKLSSSIAAAAPFLVKGLGRCPSRWQAWTLHLAFVS